MLIKTLSSFNIVWSISLIFMLNIRIHDLIELVWLKIILTLIIEKNLILSSRCFKYQSIHSNGISMSLRLMYAQSISCGICGVLWYLLVTNTWSIIESLLGIYILLRCLWFDIRKLILWATAKFDMRLEMIIVWYDGLLFHSEWPPNAIGVIFNIVSWVLSDGDFF